MDLLEFDRGLRKVTKEDSRVRPFVCSGSPLLYKIFVVGLNPATDVLFWPFWSAERGFDKSEWYEEYLRRRHDGQPSHTRRRINAALAAVPEAKCLESNLYQIASKQFADLPQELRSTDIFEFLLASIKPLALLVHGAEAARHIQPHCGGPLSKHAPQQADFGYGPVVVLGGDHLTRFWKDAEIRTGLQTLVSHLK
jgi:hypothetical protein